jgi:NADH dehydrogenase
MILVAGATGLLGSRIAHQLLQTCQEVRVLVRPNAPYQTLVEKGASPVFGDLKEPSSLDAALAGVDTVITTATAGQRGGDDTIESVDLAGNCNLIDAAAQVDVRQFIFVSTLGADAAAPIPMFRAKGMAEMHLRRRGMQSGMGYTILQPNAFMDIWLPLVVGVPLQQDRPVTLIGEGTRRHSYIAIQDVAAFALAAIGHPAAHQQTLVLGGPDAISWRDIIAAVEHALGRSLRVETLNPGEVIPFLPPVVSEIMAAQGTYDSPIEMDAVTQTFGVTLTSLETWVRSVFLPMLAAQRPEAA